MPNRGLIVLALFVLIVTSCGTDAVAETTSSTAATTTSEVVEPVGDPTPWRSLEPVEALAAELDGVVIDQICMTFDIGLTAPFNWVHVSDPLIDVFSLLGVEARVVRAGEFLDPACTSGLAIDLDGRRSGRDYEDPTTHRRSHCWTGYSVEGEIQSWLGGDIVDLYDFDDALSPPTQTIDCPPQDEELDALPLLQETLGQAFGLDMEMAIRAVLVDLPTRRSELFKLYALGPVVAGLFHSDSRVRDLSGWILTERFSGTSRLMDDEAAWVPQVIAALDWLQGEGHQTARLEEALESAFEAILEGSIPDGVDTECPAHWWRLWTGTWSDGAACDTL